ncbi:MAG TPA: sigma 54-interacting transcriptional regulator [Saprospiraceae bacterium]|jgi:magnesium chelatase subunit I|nr:sigma 54-interacting transcriptional regulator [Saprospiraceae bacterium]HQW96476.1 sigma 54-interacting transcriptional regulator [Saprospiraceae bacterium]
MNNITTIGALKASGYIYKSIKDEIRSNLIKKLQNKEKAFKGIFGFDDTVIPDLERAFLSKHNILLLGLRGQAKTRIARLSVDLLDEYIPIIKGSELNEDPLNPITKASKDLIVEQGDETEIEWIHRNNRFLEKLATPDVSIADLIGDIDPIKAANNRWSYTDERSIHYGLVPRSNRCIFVLNELPDLQARIQVSLLNILQEGDIQIRGYKMRLPLDIQFIFTANPEDYTNRGNIITPLKDRIDSQILTHYPDQISIAKKITLQEARIEPEVLEKVFLSPYVHDILERIAFEARESEFIDEQSGVSARLSISGLENLYSAAYRRLLRGGYETTMIRIVDFIGVIPSITGKVELIYEGEQEGPYNVALHLLDASIKEEFLSIFPNPEKKLKKHEEDAYQKIKNWFTKGNTVEFWYNDSDEVIHEKLRQVDGLEDLVVDKIRNHQESIVLMEIILHGLSELNIISRDLLDDKISFNDSLANMIDDLLNENDFDEN